MQDHGSSDPRNHRNGLSEEQIVQAAILAVLLDLYPAHMTLSEIVLEMTKDPDDFAERDAVQVALDTLRRAGLLHVGEQVVPSRAAVVLHELMLA
jgi:hypothetical protein